MRNLWLSRLEIEIEIEINQSGERKLLLSSVNFDWSNSILISIFIIHKVNLEKLRTTLRNKLVNILCKKTRVKKTILLSCTIVEKPKISPSYAWCTFVRGIILEWRICRAPHYSFLYIKSWTRGEMRMSCLKDSSMFTSAPAALGFSCSWSISRRLRLTFLEWRLVGGGGGFTFHWMKLKLRYNASEWYRSLVRELAEYRVLTCT